jgi:hypothetical protein
MIYLQQMAGDAFVVLQADTPAEQAREIVTDLERTTHLIVRDPRPQGGHYLVSRQEALDLLARPGRQASLAEALHLEQRELCPILDAYADAETAPDRVIVIQDRRLIGFVDYTEPDADWSKPFARGPLETMMGAKGLDRPAGVSRALVTRFRERVPLGDTAVLGVTLSAQAGASPLALVAELGSQITVVVEPLSGFELEGEGEGTLTVSDEQETMPLRFKLRATALGPGQIWVYAYQGVQPVGRLPVVATVVPAGEAVAAAPTKEPWPLAPLSVRQPDLTLEIHRVTSGLQQGYQMRLAARDPALGLHFQPFAPVFFDRDPEAHFAEFYRGIEGVLLDTPEHCEEATLILEGKGYHLFETLFPADLRTLLWSLKERITTVRIVSDEPWIPWELCKLEGSEDGRVQPGPFFCEAFAVTRWMAGIDPKPDLTLKRMAVVVPEESGLPHAPQERAYLQSLAGDERQIEPIPARLVKLIKALELGEHDGWHFTGHGTFSASDPNNSSIELDDYGQMTPENLSGPARNLGQARPLVFLNACQAGRGAMSLTGMGGWANGFLAAGAGAFIGAHWSIDDELALEFAQEFYRCLLQEGQTIGEAARQSRLRARDARPGDPTWLAYTVYADPTATVQ